MMSFNRCSVGRPTLPGHFDLVLIPQPRERYSLDEVRRELVKLMGALRKGRPPRHRRQR